MRLRGIAKTGQRAVAQCKALLLIEEKRGSVVASIFRLNFKGCNILKIFFANTW